MKFFLVLATLGAASAQGICADIADFIPTELGCTCTDASSASTLQCQLSLMDGAWTVGARVILDMCGSNPDVSMYFDYGSGYQLVNTWEYGTSQSVPLPDLSISAMGYTLGAELEITLSGNLADTTLSLALGACVGTSCDADIPSCYFIPGCSDLPVTILEFDDLDFSGVCSGASNMVEN
jgi:hypothetical protein